MDSVIRELFGDRGKKEQKCPESAEPRGDDHCPVQPRRSGGHGLVIMVTCYDVGDFLNLPTRPLQALPRPICM